MKLKKLFKWIVFLGLLGGGGYYYYGILQGKEAENKPEYDRARAARRDLQVVVEATGEVQPRNRLDVKPPIAGRLEELRVDEGDEVDKGQIIGWISSTERATLLDAALATSKEEYEYWQKLYKPTPLVSPLKGTIIARNFEPGQSINANNAIVVIADDLIVVANLDETDIGQIRLGQKVIMRLDAYPDTEFSGVVEKIAYDAQVISNVTVYQVDVRPDHLPPFGRSGMTVNLEFIVEEKEGALTVPASAVQQRTGGKKADERKAGGKKAGGEGRPKFADMSPEQRKTVMIQRMRERGLSEEEIKERIAQFAAGGGPRNGKKGKRKEEPVYYVLVDSGNPEMPEERVVKIGINDGSYIEIIEGLKEGDEVLIPKIKMGSSKKSTNNPLIPMRGPGMGRGPGGGSKR